MNIVACEVFSIVKWHDQEEPTISAVLYECHSLSEAVAIKRAELVGFKYLRDGGMCEHFTLSVRAVRAGELEF